MNENFSSGLKAILMLKKFLRVPISVYSEYFSFDDWYIKMKYNIVTWASNGMYGHSNEMYKEVHNINLLLSFSLF